MRPWQNSFVTVFTPLKTVYVSDVMAHSQSSRSLHGPLFMMLTQETCFVKSVPISASMPSGSIE